MTWTGANDAGSRTYAANQRAAVIAELRRHVGKNHATTMNDLAIACRINGRALRQLISDLDGVELLLAFNEDVIYVAETADDADQFTGRLRHQAERMLERVQRRDTLAVTLPRGQMSFDVPGLESR